MFFRVFLLDWYMWLNVYSQLAAKWKDLPNLFLYGANAYDWKKKWMRTNQNIHPTKLAYCQTIAIFCWFRSRVVVRYLQVLLGRLSPSYFDKSINKLGLSGFSLLIIVCTFRPWWSLGGRADGGFVYAMSRKQTPREPVLLDAAEASEDESSPLCAEYYRVSPRWVHYKPTAIPLLAHFIPSNDCFETDLLNLHFRIKQFFHCSCVNSG